MPQAAYAAVLAAGYGTFAAVAAYVVVTVVINVAINKVAGLLTGKPKQASGEARSRDVTIRGTIEPGQLIYGQVRTGGFVAYFACSGQDNRYLWFVVVVARHQCQAIEQCALDGTVIDDADIDGSGTVIAAAWASGGSSRLSIFKHLGTMGQVVDAAMTSDIPEWTSDHKGAGIAYVAYRLDRSEAVYPNGAPQSFFSLVKGRRLYDSRLDSTNGGSGSHRVNDATTWAWSRNWALCNRDYIAGGSIGYDVATPDRRLGLAEADSRIDDAFIIAAANISDETPLIPPASPTTTQPRYTCDTQLSCGNTHRENMDILLSAGNGHLSYVKGKYRLYAGAYDAPAINLTEDDIQGPVDVSTHPIGEDVYNMVTGTFFDELRNWTPQDFPSVTDTTYQTDDGGLRARPIKLDATRDTFRAQRIAIQILKQSRNKITVKFSQLSPKAMNIAQWDTFTATIAEFGWVSMVFRCLDWSFLPSGFVAITARVETSTAYSDPAVATYSDAAENDPPFVQIETPGPPTNLTATAYATAIRFEVVLPVYFAAGSVVEIWEYTSSTPFSSATKIAEGRTNVILVPKRDETTRYYWARIRASTGDVSDTYPASNGAAGVASFVQSGDIALGAAASVLSATDTSQTTSTIAESLIDITVPSVAVAHDALVTVVGDIWKTTGADPASIYIARLASGSPSGTVGELFSVTQTASPGGRFSLLFEYSASAGTSYTYSLWYSAVSLGNFGHAANLSMKVELIKR